MNGAVVVLALNIGVASFFAAGYAIVALANRGQRAALWFSASYLIGMLSPVADFLVPFLGAPEPLEWLSYSSFLLAILSISATFSLFHRRPVPWIPILAILAAGLALRAMIWEVPRATLAYGMAYQTPFMLASALAVWTVISTERRRPLHLLLAGIFAIIAVHFLAKPFLALSFGGGRALGDYTKTTYALLSQASTGILLLAAGIVLLLLVAQRAIADSQLASETDPLSGLTNRRGFERRAQEMLTRVEQRGIPLSVAVFDLDHFKRINDSFGHAAGDAAIINFGRLLQATAPGAAVVARLGGEEFAMLIEDAGANSAWLHAEAVRINAARAALDDRQSTTVSGGLAERRAHESLAELIRRADLACYEAKGSGRNRIIHAAEPGRASARTAPAPLHRLAG